MQTYNTVYCQVIKAAVKFKNKLTKINKNMHKAINTSWLGFNLRYPSYDSQHKKQ